MRLHLAVIVVVILAHIGCSKPTPQSSNAVSNPASSGDASTINAMGVGDYVIERSTLTEILSTDTPEARRRFSEQGLYFQFDRGRTLTGITMTSATFRLRSGLAVGASADAVRKELSAPKSEGIENDKLTLDALVYDDFTFILDSDTVSAIFIGGT